MEVRGFRSRAIVVLGQIRGTRAAPTRGILLRNQHVDLFAQQAAAPARPKFTMRRSRHRLQTEVSFAHVQTVPLRTLTFISHLRAEESSVLCKRPGGRLRNGLVTRSVRSCG